MCVYVVVRGWGGGMSVCGVGECVCVCMHVCGVSGDV